MTATRRDILNARRSCAAGEGLAPTSVHEIDLNVRCGLPDITAVDHTGRKLKFYEDCMEGKIFLINFFSIKDDERSGQTAALAKVVKALGDRVGRDVFVTSITVDPENDTVEALAEHAKKHGVRQGWRFIRMSGLEAAIVAQRMYHFNRGAPAGMGRLIFYGNGMNGQRVWGTVATHARPDDVAWRVASIIPKPKPKVFKRAGPARPGENAYPWSNRARV